MTYFGFLALFLGVPILLLALALWAGRRPNDEDGAAFPGLSNAAPALVVLIHVVVALLYTTPWDNYLVATRVWWYDPDLVTGLTIGWVPIEEYTFFIVQPILTGLWLLFLARRGRRPAGPYTPRPSLRRASLAVVGLIWVASVALLLSRWQPGTYLGLELVWALPPIMLQLAFGADILWRHRRLVLPVLLVPTLYLSAADALAITSGTWTINPEQSLDLLIGGLLPVEELLFFFLTNTLVVFGSILALADESAHRFAEIRQRIRPVGSALLLRRQGG